MYNIIFLYPDIKIPAIVRFKGILYQLSKSRTIIIYDLK